MYAGAPAVSQTLMKLIWKGSAIQNSVRIFKSVSTTNLISHKGDGSPYLTTRRPVSEIKSWNVPQINEENIPSHHQLLRRPRRGMAHPSFDRYQYYLSFGVVMETELAYCLLRDLLHWKWRIFSYFSLTSCSLILRFFKTT